MLCGGLAAEFCLDFLRLLLETAAMATAIMKAIRIMIMVESSNRLAIAVGSYVLAVEVGMIIGGCVGVALGAVEGFNWSGGKICMSGLNYWLSIIG